jgi:CubicO group peptidase (beta-lactamase class C family)
MKGPRYAAVLLGLALAACSTNGSASGDATAGTEPVPAQRRGVNLRRCGVDSVLAGLPERITAAVAEDRLVSVSIAVVMDDDMIFCRAFGFADLERQRPATPNTIYPAGSVTKVLTATMLARLWEQGVVDLEDSVQEYLPEYQPRSRHAGDRATSLRQLASHTSGLPRDAPANFWCDYSRFIWYVTGGETPLTSYVDAHSLLASLSELELVHPPEVYAHYSNLNFQILGLALERACGRSFTTYVEDEILAPLGMDDSTFDLAPEAQRRMATGYVSTGPTAEPLVAPRHDLGCAVFSGGLFTTAEDLARFLSSQWSGGQATGDEILEAGTLRRMRTPQSVHLPGLHECYGLGWCVARIGRHDAIEQNGALVGYHAHVSAVPRLKLGIAALSNCSNSMWRPDACKELARGILADLADALVQAEATARDAGAAGSTHELFEGLYALPGGVAHLDVRNDGMGLKVTLVEDPSFSEVFVPVSPSVFCFASDPNEEPALFFDSAQDDGIASVVFLGHRFRRVPPGR